MLAQSYNFAVRKKELMNHYTHKINALVALGHYMMGQSPAWEMAKDNALQGNQWFTKEMVEVSARQIATNFLQEDKLNLWMSGYKPNGSHQVVGITMAGNIPMVGFHDMLCVYLSGQKARLKLASKDTVLMKHLLAQLASYDPTIAAQIEVTDNLRNCDAYIATGSNNTARYFEQYFGKYPHIIRRNRTSVAVLDGTETEEELSALAQDVFLYFGLGCRNVTQICVPEGYSFEKLFQSFESYKDYIHHHKYCNNYDYYLSIYLLNRVPYLSNNFILLVENEVPFSAVSVLNYRYYNDKEAMIATLASSTDIQCVVAKELMPFGKAQEPSLSDFADGVDTMAFLCSL